MEVGNFKMVKTKNKNIWIIIGVILLVILMQGKKEVSVGCQPASNYDDCGWVSYELDTTDTIYVYGWKVGTTCSSDEYAICIDTVPCGQTKSDITLLNTCGECEPTADSKYCSGTELNDNCGLIVDCADSGDICVGDGGVDTGCVDAPPTCADESGSCESMDCCLGYLCMTEYTSQSDICVDENADIRWAYCTDCSYEACYVDDNDVCILGAPVFSIYPSSPDPCQIAGKTIDSDSMYYVSLLEVQTAISNDNNCDTCGDIGDSCIVPNDCCSGHCNGNNCIEDPIVLVCCKKGLISPDYSCETESECSALTESIIPPSHSDFNNCPSACGCTITTWTPLTSTKTCGTAFTQTSNCDTEKEASGTRCTNSSQVCKSGNCVTKSDGEDTDYMKYVWIFLVFMAIMMAIKMMGKGKK